MTVDEELCSLQNITLCGDPPLSFDSFDAICNDGALTIIFGILLFLTFFTIKQIVHHTTKKYEQIHTHGLYDTRDDNGNLISHWFEEIFCKPFIPASLEHLFVSLYFLWFVVTIPIAFTRYYEKLWAQVAMAQHGPLNLLSMAVGCGTLDMKSIQYTEELSGLEDIELSDQKNTTNIPQKIARFITRRGGRNRESTSNLDENAHFKEVDWIFTTHLIFGILWLSVGFFQIFLIRSGWSTEGEVRIMSHRWFGRLVAVPSVCIHMAIASMVAIKDPVNQIFSIKVMYLTSIMNGVLLVGFGVYYAVKARQEPENSIMERHYRNLHKARMGTLYIRTISGAGAVRITVWLLWMLGKFFSFETRIFIDRGECQQFSKQLWGEDDGRRGFLGDADMCWQPVFLNYMLMDILNTYVDWNFFCVLKQENSLEEKDKITMQMKFDAMYKMVIAYILLVIYEIYIDAPDIIFHIFIISYGIYTRIYKVMEWLAGEIQGERQERQKRKALGGASNNQVDDMTIRRLILGIFLTTHGSALSQPEGPQHQHQD